MRTLLLIVVTASLTACHGHLKPPAERLAGTWSSTFSGAVVEIIAEDDTSGIYVAMPADGEMDGYSGRFKATQTEFTIVNDDDGPCPGQTGRYEFAIMTGVIQFTLKHDECEGREPVMEEAWVRVFSPDPDTDND